MGYTTDFSGQFTLKPHLTPAQVAYLQKFNETRRMKRNAEITAARPDPIREAVGLPVGVEGGYFVGADGQEYGAAGIVDYNAPPAGQPGLWCQWTPSNYGGMFLEWDGGEKFYSYVEWLEYIIEHFLRPWGVSLSGQVSWQGEDSDDRGVIFAKNNRVQAVESQIVTPEPDWEEA